MSLLLVYLRKISMYYKYYKVMALTAFLAPIFAIVDYYLTGKFVDLINFYGKYIHYFYFLIISIFISINFYISFRYILSRFYSRGAIIEASIYGVRKVWFFRIMSNVIEEVITYLPVIVFVCIFFVKDYVKVLLVAISSFLLIFPGVTYSLLLSPLLLYFRGRETRIVEWIVGELSSILVPTHFSIYVFQRSRLVEILLPSVGIVEELRKYFILGFMDLRIFLLAILVNIVYFMIGVLVFIKVYNYARLKGWIGLK